MGVATDLKYNEIEPIDTLSWYYFNTPSDPILSKFVERSAVGLGQLASVLGCII